MVCDGSAFGAKLNIAGGLSFYQDSFYLCCVNTGVMVFKNPLSLAHTACGKPSKDKSTSMCLCVWNSSWLYYVVCLFIIYQVGCLRPCLYLSVFYVSVSYEKAAVQATQMPAIVIC